MKRKKKAFAVVNVYLSGGKALLNVGKIDTCKVMRLSTKTIGFEPNFRLTLRERE